MEVSSSLLVAMMFVMVLSIGIGNILVGLSSLLNQRSPREIDISWRSPAGIHSTIAMAPNSSYNP